MIHQASRRTHTLIAEAKQECQAIHGLNKTVRDCGRIVVFEMSCRHELGEMVCGGGGASVARATLMRSIQSIFHSNLYRTPQE